ncbi:DNA polymerase theta/eta [Reticulomyxa filosa]|uniref:DNA polymerase theta/eta n=1 Tax=Reticulomyxa filosa TaxID=46433 RepID=X6MYP7_RETFI|nr:DNA polymerase theta/eta [Reticulomyxa filosa]|eukprot:ETO18916.1 DNA polymerase theta/eta [Reticulomyxa filosa]
MGKNTELENVFEASYVKKSCALLTAHLMGLPIPEVLHDEYLFVLQEAPRLLDVMIDMTLSRERYWAQGTQLIQVKQAVVQGVWPFEPKLKQLPHWTLGIEKLLNTKGFFDLTQLNSLDPVKLREILSEAYTKGSNDVSHLISESENAQSPDSKTPDQR